MHVRSYLNILAQPFQVIISEEGEICNKFNGRALEFKAS